MDELSLAERVPSSHNQHGRGLICVTRAGKYQCRVHRGPHEATDVQGNQTSNGQMSPDSMESRNSQPLRVDVHRDGDHLAISDTAWRGVPRLTQMHHTPMHLCVCRWDT